MAVNPTSPGISDSSSTSREPKKRRFDDQSHRGGYESFGQYMREKTRKLNEQINIVSSTSDLFKGISIYVNGLTDPPALELRRLMVENGGEYHTYYFYEKTTYTVATNLATAKIVKLRKNEKVIRPDWITESIRARKLLPEESFLLFGNENEASTSNALLDGAKNPNFLSEFYSRSRLHLISTLAQEMKQWVQKLRTDGGLSDCGSRARLNHLVDPNYEKQNDSYYGHFDFDCFFVSVALRKRPDLIGKPVAVTHSRGNKSGPGFAELASCNYEARRFNIKNGMLMRDALKNCQNLVCLPYEFDEYRSTSLAIYQIISGFTHEIRAISCDEMYVDLSAIARDKQISDIMGIVKQMRTDILEATGCPVSVGVGTNLLLARLATRKAKPNGQFMVNSDLEGIHRFMSHVKVSDLPGVGFSVLSKLDNLIKPVYTCADLRDFKKESLQKLVGNKLGKQLYEQSRGIDYTELIDKKLRQSVSCDINYGIRLTTTTEFSSFIQTLADELKSKLLTAEMDAQSITLKLMIRSADAPINPAKFMGHGRCDVHTKSSNIANPFCDPAIIHREVMKLFEALHPCVEDIRGIGVQLTKLTPKTAAGIALQKKKDFFIARRRRLVVDDESLSFDAFGSKKKEDTLPTRSLEDVPTGIGMCMESGLLEHIVETSVSEDVDEETTRALTEFFFYRARLSDVATIRKDFLFLERLVFDRAKSTTWFCLTEHIRSIVNRLSVERYDAEMIRYSCDKSIS